MAEERQKESPPKPEERKEDKEVTSEGTQKRGFRYEDTDKPKPEDDPKPPKDSE